METYWPSLLTPVDSIKVSLVTFHRGPCLGLWMLLDPDLANRVDDIALPRQLGNPYNSKQKRTDAPKLRKDMISIFLSSGVRYT